MEPKFQVSLKIRKPVAEVFEAVVDPTSLSNFFVSRASGRLAQGAAVQWEFAEAPGVVEVVVGEVVQNQKITLRWAGGRSYDTAVEMLFEPTESGDTIVRISEAGWRVEEEGIELACGNAGGWMHMMCCLKAYLEYGLRLRAGGAI